MNPVFWCVLGLLIVIAAISLWFGWHWGFEACAKKISYDIRKEFEREFAKKYEEDFQKLVKEASEVERKRVRLVWIKLLMEELEKDEQSINRS